MDQSIMKLTTLMQLMSWDECCTAKTIVDAVMLQITESHLTINGFLVAVVPFFSPPPP